MAAGALSVGVQGNRLVDGEGRALRLGGVNRSGAEYACVQGRGIFDGPVDDDAIVANKAWGANSVRVPLNEHCWLGINGIDPTYGGDAYRRAIASYVERLHAHGLYAILDLHWSAAGSAKADAQAPMPDRDHAPDFWRGVAASFKNDPAVMFDLFNEPHLDEGFADAWSCWRDGCIVHGWQSAGMQSLVDAVRSTGARQPILVGGLSYANDVSGWAAHAPVDPAHALVLSFHVYNFNRCTEEECWTRDISPLARTVPVVTGEIGEDDCTHAFVDRYMRWADDAGISYLAWAWNTWGEPTPTRCGPKIVLIADYAGTPTPYGIGVRDHLLAR